jgi:hypothetical protein
VLYFSVPISMFSVFFYFSVFNQVLFFILVFSHPFMFECLTKSYILVVSPIIYKFSQKGSHYTHKLSQKNLPSECATASIFKLVAIIRHHVVRL